MKRLAILPLLILALAGCSLLTPRPVVATLTWPAGAETATVSIVPNQALADPFLQVGPATPVGMACPIVQEGDELDPRPTCVVMDGFVTVFLGPLEPKQSVPTIIVRPTGSEIGCQVIDVQSGVLEPCRTN